MKLVLILSALWGICQTAAYTGKADDAACKHPNWKCDCKLAYDCRSNENFPRNVGDDPTKSDYFKDLAPPSFPLLVSGKRWRRKYSTQEEYCKQECNDRMNAFLSLDPATGMLTDYSYSALCLALLDRSPSQPFHQDNVSSEPCCTIYLEYGLQWCPKKWVREITEVRCYTEEPYDTGFANPPLNTDTHVVFSADSGCTPGMLALNWCTSSPVCAIPPP